MKNLYLVFALMLMANLTYGQFNQAANISINITGSPVSACDSLTTTFIDSISPPFIQSPVVIFSRWVPGNKELKNVNIRLTCGLYYELEIRGAQTFSSWNNQFYDAEYRYELNDNGTACDSIVRLNRRGGNYPNILPISSSMGNTNANCTVDTTRSYTYRFVGRGLPLFIRNIDSDSSYENNLGGFTYTLREIPGTFQFNHTFSSGNNPPFLFGAFNSITISNPNPFTNIGTNNSYTLTIRNLAVTDTNGLLMDAFVCQTSQSLNVTIFPDPSVTSIVTQPSCFGDSGSINLTPDIGTQPFTYSWNDTSSSEDRASLAPGSYFTNITDGNGCTSQSDTFTIVEPPLLFISIDTISQPLCNGNFGSATVSASGGTLPYTYSWNTTPVQNTSNANNLLPGTYTAYVTDANGCSKEAQIIVNPTPPLETTISSTTPICANDGSASVMASGGTGTYSYSWTNGASTSTISGIDSGNYSVLVTDGNGCTSQQTITIGVPTGVFSAELTLQKGDIQVISSYSYQVATYSIKICNLTGEIQSIPLTVSLPCPFIMDSTLNTGTGDYIFDYEKNQNPIFPIPVDPNYDCHYEVFSTLELQPNACDTFLIAGYFNVTSPFVTQCYEMPTAVLTAQDGCGGNFSDSSNVCINFGCPGFISLGKLAMPSNQDGYTMATFQTHTALTELTGFETEIFYPEFLNPDLNSIYVGTGLQNITVEASQNPAQTVAGFKSIFLKADFDPTNLGVFFQFYFHYVANTVPTEVNCYPIFIRGKNNGNLNFLDCTFLNNQPAKIVIQPAFLTFTGDSFSGIPNPDFTYSSNCLVANFTAFEGNLKVHKWDFGDTLNPSVPLLGGGSIPIYSYSGPGVYKVTHTVINPITGMANVTSQMITIPPTVPFSFNALPIVCINDGIIDLSSFVTPIGGTFSGIGVSGSNFDLAVSGEGTFPITYNVTDSNGCFRSMEQTITVKNCCSGTDTTIFEGNSSSLSDSIFNGQDIGINEELTIDQNLTFNNCTLHFGPLTKIVVRPGNILEINGSDLSACNANWAGIEVEPGGKVILNNSVIRNAPTAIKTFDDGIFEVIGSTIYSNNEAIRAQVNLSAPYVSPSRFENTDIIGDNPGTANGINLINLNSDNPVSFNIGNPVAGLNNNFSDLARFGIAGQSINLIIKNCWFNNFEEGGIGIDLTSKVLTNPLNILIGGPAAEERNQFISVSNGISLISKFNNVQIWNNYFENGEVGILGQHGYSTITIQNNEFNDFEIPVQLMQNSFAGLNIQKNRIMNSGIIDLPKGIIISEAETRPGTYGSYRIENNNISNVNAGVYLINIHKPVVSNNIISVVNLSAKYTAGVKVEGGFRPVIFSNTISAASKQYAIEGVRMEITSLPVVRCNTTMKTSRGLVFSGPNKNARVINNSFSTNFTGIVLHNSGEIGPQYTVSKSGVGFGPSNNKWLGTYTGNSRHILSIVKTDGSLSSFHVKSNFAPTNVGADATSSNVLVYNTSEQSSEGCPAKVDNISSFSNEQTVLLSLKENKANEQKPEHIKWHINRDLHMRIKGDSLNVTSDSELLAFSDSLDNSPMSKLEKVPEILYKKHVASQEDIDLARAINESVVTENLQEENYKLFNEKLISYHETKILSEDGKTTFIDLASRCPHTDGPAVFLSRAIIMEDKLNKTQYVNDCEMFSQIGSANAMMVQNPGNNENDEYNGEESETQTEISTNSNSNSITGGKKVVPTTVHPNPAISQINFELSGNGPVEIEIMDIAGKVVYKTTTNDSNSKLNVDTKNLINGFYSWKVTRNGNVENGRIVIMK